jgi:phospholipid/cholesterol/gamma-HCH transport system ATP-binding protein
MTDEALIAVSGITLGFGDRVILQALDFVVKRGSIFAIMGGSGCGKSTMLRAMIGLQRPQAGTVTVAGADYWACDAARRTEIDRGFGVLFQGGALWSAMSVGDNVALPLRLFTRLNGADIDRLVRFKLALVGLADAFDLRPAELSGGMRKRAGLARALALDPEVLFLDEPSAGLDPINARRMDDLILNLRDGLGATIVMVSHELDSLLGVADDGVFLDAATRGAIAHGAPRALRDTCRTPQVMAFMHRERLPQA